VPTPRAERRLAAILAADVVGYSRLMERDESGTLEAGRLRPHVGEVLPLEQVVLAHQMLEGTPHKAGKIVLSVAA
jgi:adenylate cyclase